MSSSSSSSEEEKEKIPFSELVKQWSEKIGKNERMNWSSRKYKIDDDDAKAIAEVLKTNTTLTSMDAYNKKITAVGAKAIAEALKTNKTLTDIRLSRKPNSLSFSLSFLNSFTCFCRCIFEQATKSETKAEMRLQRFLKRTRRWYG